MSKQVTFSDVAYVVLIPSRIDYKNAGLHNQVWYNSDEFKRMIQQASYDVAHINKNSNNNHNHNNNHTKKMYMRYI